MGTTGTVCAHRSRVYHIVSSLCLSSHSSRIVALVTGGSRLDASHSSRESEHTLLSTGGGALGARRRRPPGATSFTNESNLLSNYFTPMGGMCTRHIYLVRPLFHYLVRPLFHYLVRPLFHCLVRPPLHYLVRPLPRAWTSVAERSSPSSATGSSTWAKVRPILL